MGPTGAVKLTAATVFGDGAKDTLTGGPGQDWFFSDGQDTVTDRSASEIGTHTDSLREEKHPPLPCAEPTPVIDWSGSSKDSLEALARGDSNGKVSTPPPWTRAFVLDLAAAADTGDPNADIRITIPVAVAPQPGIGHREYVGVVG